jgi:photosystem II stability/assembly factor-like uncharacterized protein
MKWVLLFLSLFFTSMLFSQNWLENLPKNKSREELNLFDYKNAFYQYWEPYNVDKGYYLTNGVKKKAAGWKQFKRWEYNMENQVNPKTGEFPQKTAQSIYQEYLNLNALSSTSALGNWVCMGTNTSTGGYAGIGRINCIAFHPTDNNIYWVGAASGGLWQTTNNGSSWTCLTDTTGVLAVSDIVIPADYAVSHTIYIATGDKDHWDNHSIGVLKSTNGGLNWNTTALNFSLSNGDMVNTLLLDPSDNQTLIAATSNGVFKTTNGGSNWSNLLTSTVFIDLEYKPGNFNTLYGSTENGSIYMSSNGGSTWSQVFNDINARRIELAVSPNQPEWVYAMAVADNSGLYAIYKSTNSGLTFTQVFAGTTSNLLGWSADGSDSGGQGWYDLSMAVAPSNANEVVIGGINTWRSINGGTSWTIVNHWVGSNSQAVHADKHMLKYRSNGNLFECNDGGVYISTDNGSSWTDKTNGMVISQMYKLGVSQSVANEVITGLQDNGSKLLSGGNWRDVKGGDGMECLIDYSNANVQYATYVNGQISRTTDHWVNNYTDIEPSGAGSGAWVTPFIIDPANNQILYAGYADVWKTTDRGNTWTQISAINSVEKIRSMAIAPSNSQVIYVADPFTIWKTTNGGSSWINITGSLPIGSVNITNIAVKNNDPNTLWITMSAYNANRVFQSINGGSTWSNISAGLPQLPAYSIVQNKQSTTEVQLYVGTELGVYFKKGSNNWVAFNAGLPNVKIGEIEIYYAANPQNSKLRAATYGRGLWETAVYYSSLPMAYISSTTTQNNTAQLAPGSVNQEIIGIEIQINGNLSPLSVTSFSFNTAASTSPATDISLAKLFISPGSTFDTSLQFGTAIISPNGSFTITGAHPLSDGTNYFWLTYDISSTATLNNVVDASCTSLTVGTVKTPLITNPSGNRTIAIIYCSASSNICDEYISNVSIGSINNTSACSSGGYVDYTAISTDIQTGTSLGISVTNGMPYTLDQCGIWIDWNNNGNFMDDTVISISGTPGGGPYTAVITPPLNTAAGIKRMRIRIHYNEEATSPCGIANYGEVEDYSINLLPACLPPATQALSFLASASTSHSMSISYTRGNGDAVLILAKAGSAVDTDPFNGITYSYDTVFGNGNQIGSGNYVVYNGTASLINITSLASGTTYYYAVYEYSAASKCYLRPALTGNASTYCEAGAISMNYEYISNVSIANINQASGKGSGGYQDFTSQTADLKIGVNTSLTINITDFYSTDQILIWVDWNQDGDFTDATENVFASSGTLSNSLIIANFTPPPGTLSGITRMRIRLHDLGSGPNSSPCGNADYGEVEDYTLNLSYLTTVFTAAVSNDWENAANWDIALPAAYINAVIPANKLAVINSGSNETNNLTIAALGKLTMNTSADLWVHGCLSMLSDSSGSASLLNNGSLNADSCIVERYIPVNISDEFHQLASPVTNQRIDASFNPQIQSFYGWNESNGSWLAAEDSGFLTLNTAMHFTPGKGYAATYPVTSTKKFNGILNNSAISTALTVSPGTYSGWNLVANPYPSAINWNTASAYSRSMLENAGVNEYAYWVWNPTTGNYGSFISNGLSGTNGVSDFIAPMQGFWVKAASPGVFTIQNNAREHASQTWLKTTSAETMSIHLKITTSENTFSDELIVRFGNQNDGGGAEKMYSMETMAPEIYSTKLNKTWSINLLTVVADHSIIPIGFKPGINGSYKISATGTQTFGSVVLEDLKTATQQLLSTLPDYSFNAQTTDDPNRFLLHFSTTGINDLHEKKPAIYYYNQSLTVFNPWLGKTILTVYDIKGRIIQSNIVGYGTNSFPLLIAQGVYFLKMLNEQNLYVRKEVVY